MKTWLWFAKNTLALVAIVIAILLIIKAVNTFTIVPI